MKKLRAVLCLTLCALMLCALCACNGNATDDDWAYIQKKGTMIIGITEYPPLNYYDESGKLTGFETEFAQAVCDKLGVKAEFVIIDWKNKAIDLAAKTIDCIWNGMTVTDELKEQLDFSRSYLRNRQAVLVRAEDADKYAAIADLYGVNMTAEEGSAGEDAILADDKLAAKYVPVVNQARACMEVAAGTSDAAVMDYFIALYSTGEESDYDNLQVLDLEISDSEEFGIGLRKGSTAVAKINGAIDALIADGTLAEIGAKYNLTDSLILK